MDLKKLLKLLGVPEQFTSKSKVFSGFGLGVIASILLLTVLFLNHPLKTSFLYPVFQGFNSIGSKAPIVSWPFQFPSSSSGSLNSSVSQNLTNSNGGAGILENDHDGIVVERSKNGSSLGSNDVGSGTNGTHEGIASEHSKNSSLIGTNGGNLASEKPQSANNATFIDSRGRNFSSEAIPNRNFSTSAKNASNVNSGGGNLASGRTQSANVTSIVKNTSSSGKALGIEEKTHHGNLSREVNSTKNSSKEPKVKSIESNNTAGIADSSTGRKNGGHVTDSGVSVRSNDTKGSNLWKNQTQNSTKEQKAAGSVDSGIVGDFAKCDIFDGRWVRDEGKPYYPGGSCPYIDRDFDCYLNGRPDSDFLKWRWQPNHCNIPSLNATDFLERLRGGRLVFVGDSLNRNMWESLVCILRHSVADKKKVYEISGKHEFKKKGFYAFHYEEYNCSIDFVSSPFLVRETPITNKNGLSETLRLDLMDKTSSFYHDADVIVFNTGHWWTHEKTSKGENYYQEGSHVYPRLKVMDAYTKALTTWARWVDKNVDTKRSQVFFRGYSLTHFKGGQWNSGGQCHQEIEPIYNVTYLAKYPQKMKALEHVIQEMKTPVGYLNISKLTDYRKDAHPSIYRKEYHTAEEKLAAVSSQDCSHWCLPGVPDTWNELLYASLLQIGRGPWKN